MTTLRRLARLVPAVAAAAVFASGPAAPSAFAASAQATGPARTSSESWTVTPGGTIKGSSGPATLQDTNTGSTISCKLSKAAGTLKSGSGLSGTGLGSLTSVTFSDCTVPGGLTFVIETSAAKTSPWSINAKSYDSGSGVTSGTITGIGATLSASGCSATLAGPTATAAGTAEITYTNSTHQLQLLGRSGGNIHIWNVSGCFGLFSNGDAMTCKATYKIQPAQTITGGGPVLDPDTSGTGPPC
jgi:hypothetical protein